MLEVRQLNLNATQGNELTNNNHLSIEADLNTELDASIRSDGSLAAWGQFGGEFNGNLLLASETV